MTISFHQPVGAGADVKELEYVSALHQTNLQCLRKDGSITDQDIVLFLMSRYGIDVTKDEVRKNIIRGLGGGDEELDDCIDLCEIVCMLLIPTLLKASVPKEDLPEGVVVPREGLLDYVLSMILHDTTGSHTPKKLNKELIQRILVAYGEADLASNDALIDEMLAAADTPEGTLNVEAFAKGLTHDVQLYDIESEARVSTNYDDVFLTKNQREDYDEEDEEEASKRHMVASERSKISKQLNTRFTAPAIDMVAGTFRSKIVTVLLWGSYIMVTFGYQGFGSTAGNALVCEDVPDSEFVYGQSWLESSKPMACQVGTSVVQWLGVFIFASLAGMIFIGCGSTGNKITCRRFWVPLLGMVFVACFTIVPYVTFTLENTTSYLITVSLVLGILTCLFHLNHSISMLIPSSWLASKPRLKAFFSPGIVRAEANIKHAAAHKLSNMTDNALTLAENKDQDTVLETHFGQGLLAFEKQGKVYVRSGGVLWTWRRFYNGSLFNEEGIWLSARLLASNCAQFLVTLFVLIAGIQATKRVSQNYDIEEARRVVGGYVDLLFNNSVSNSLAARMSANFAVMVAEFLSTATSLNETCANATLALPSCEFVGSYLSCETNGTNKEDFLCTLLDYSPVPGSLADGLTALGLLNASGFDAVRLVNMTHEYLNDTSRATVDSLYPNQKYMVMIPCMFGTIIAVLTALSLAVSYIPSVTSTTLKFRSGVIPSLRSSNFARYRYAADLVTLITGSMFWGCLIASFLVGGLVAFVIFLLLWQATVSLTQRIIALIIGISIVCIIRLVIVMSCRASYYQAFYRKKPASANISALAFECTNFSLTVGFVALRMCKLILAAALFVGRIDTPVLADGVGRFGNFEIDNYPYIFYKDILSHEAHRHPYIELLGVMYLMKLRYGENFGQRAGTTWRLIFVCALFPWLTKYRILEKEEAETKDEDDLELAVHNESVRGVDTFDDALPFNRAPSVSGASNNERPSNLMSKYKSVRTNFKASENDPAASSPPQQQATRPSRRLTSRASMKGSLLSQQLDASTKTNIEERNAELELKVLGLESNVEDLEAEVKRLREKTR